MPSSENEEDSCGPLQGFPDFTAGQLRNMQLQRNKDSSASKRTLPSTETSASESQVFHRTESPAVRRKVTLTESNISGTNVNIWSTITRRGFMWNQKDSWNDEDTETDVTFAGKCGTTRAFLKGCYHESKYNLTALSSHPRIIVYALFGFALLTTTSLLVLEVFRNQNLESWKHETEWEALESIQLLASELSKTLIPLRSLQQAVIHSNYFKDLPHKIGNYGDPGSATAILGPTSTSVKDHRNVTGICNTPELRQNLRYIIEGIEDNFDRDEVILNYRLAPYGVFCLADPLTNTKGFTTGVMNSTSSIGFDVQYSPKSMWKTMIDHIYQDGNEVDMFGPIFNFVEHGTEVFCGHLAVNMEQYNLKLRDGKSIQSWGFVMHFIDWAKAKEQSGIYEYFKERNKLFHITRTDKIYDPDIDEYVENVVTIAKSHEISMIDQVLHYRNNGETHFRPLNGVNRVMVTENTPNGQWTSHVYSNFDLLENVTTIRCAIVFASLILSALFAAMLLERQLHKNLLYRIMPREAIDKLNRNKTVVERYNLVTIFFSDIIGFTSLAGEMMPIQIMRMLNELYSEFDKIAEKHSVYKVETIGDAYMVVAGAPYRMPAPEAAQRVALFALEVTEFVKHFQTSEGDRIFIRAGIASGPVVAGVVGKSMPRYCFFGDTVNLASRMESTSHKMRIQCSDFTARLLLDAPNYTFNTEERTNRGVRGVNVKGKGLLKTYWILNVTGLRSHQNNFHEDVESAVKSHSSDMPVDRVIQSMSLAKQKWTRIGLPDSPLVGATQDTTVMINRITAILEHMLEVAIDGRREQEDLSPKAKKELHAYVTEIASLYNDVHYHNFEHASHVTISMYKLVDALRDSYHESGDVSFKFSKGIWKNGFTRFCLLYSCLIHDVQHTGQSNKILGDKNHIVARNFPGASAERNSIKVAIDLLFQPRFSHIRKAIIPTIHDRFEFGRIVFMCILCTDIATTERLIKVKARYTRAVNNRRKERCVGHANVEAFDPVMFDPKILRLSQRDIDENPDKMKLDEDCLQINVACEHLMQVADVSHLMQGWTQFIKFNYRLFLELNACYVDGSVPDPALTWTEGQLAFMIAYVLPLAERTGDICGDTIAQIGLADNARAHFKLWDTYGTAITQYFIAGCEDGESSDTILAKCRLLVNVE